MTIEINTLSRRARTPIALLFCCAACLSLGACSSSSAGPSAAVTAPAAVGRPAAPASVESVLAKQAFTPYAGLSEVVDDGLAPGESMSSLGAACLKEAGYPGDLDALPFGVRISDGLAVSPPYGGFGYLGATEAAQNGFMPDAGLSGVAALVGLDPSGPSGGSDLSAGAQAAVEKCGTIVSDFSTAQGNASLAAIQSLGQTISTDVMADPDVKKATRAWSACMASDGYNYPDPNTAFHDQIRVDIRPNTSIAANAPYDGLTSAQYEAQLAAAESDAACTTSTDLAGIYFAVQADYEQQIVDANQQKLNTDVQDYRTAYQKELADLPTLLVTTTAAPPDFPAPPTSQG